MGATALWINKTRMPKFIGRHIAYWLMLLAGAQLRPALAQASKDLFEKGAAAYDAKDGVRVH
jgi:hypothetical protein